MKRGDIVAIRDSNEEPWSDEMGLVFMYAHRRRRGHTVTYLNGSTTETAQQVKPVPRIKH